MDAAQILKPFANEHIPADTKETATCGCVLGRSIVTVIVLGGHGWQ